MYALPRAESIGEFFGVNLVVGLEALGREWQFCDQVPC